VCNKKISEIAVQVFMFENTSCAFYYYYCIVSAVRVSPLDTKVIIGLLYQPLMIDDGDFEAIGGMKIGRGNRSARGGPTPAPLCPSQIQYDQTRTRTRAAAVGSCILILDLNSANPWLSLPSENKVITLHKEQLRIRNKVVRLPMLLSGGF
jgi:hypothetical protein